jgi:uncharacterized membrane protein YesL
LNLFSVNSRFIRFLESVFELIVLNLLTLLCCIPVVTVGVAITALYRSIFNMRKGNGNIIADYFKAFRSNFRQGLLLGLIFELILISIGLYFVYFRDSIISGDGFVLLGIVLLAIFLLFPMTFAFPLLSMFENNIKQTLSNAVLLSFRHFGTSLLIILLNGLSWVLLIINPGWYIRLIPLFLIFGLSLPAWIASGLVLHVFANYSEF